MISSVKGVDIQFRVSSDIVVAFPSSAALHLAERGQNRKTPLFNKSQVAMRPRL